MICSSRLRAGGPRDRAGCRCHSWSGPGPGPGPGGGWRQESCHPSAPGSPSAPRLELVLLVPRGGPVNGRGVLCGGQCLQPLASSIFRGQPSHPSGASGRRWGLCRLPLGPCPEHSTHLFVFRPICPLLTRFHSKGGSGLDLGVGGQCGRGDHRPGQRGPPAGHTAKGCS